MPSRKIIKINSISIDKKGRYLIKAGSYSFLLNENSFTDGFFYIGKDLTESDVSFLKEESRVCFLSDYAYSLLSRKSYSKHEMKEKLLHKDPNEKMVDSVLIRLEKYGLIDDLNYAINYKESRENALYGKKFILDELRYKKGISDQILSNLSFNNEREHAQKYLTHLSRSLESYPYKTQKEKAKISLLRRGFDYEMINDLLNHSLEQNDSKVFKRLNADADRAYLRYKQKYNGYELFARVRVSLARKGYGTDEIEDAIRRIKNER